MRALQSAKYRELWFGGDCVVICEKFLFFLVYLYVGLCVKWMDKCFFWYLLLHVCVRRLCVLLPFPPVPPSILYTEGTMRLRMTRLTTFQYAAVGWRVRGAGSAFCSARFGAQLSFFSPVFSSGGGGLRFYVFSHFSCIPVPPPPSVIILLFHCDHSSCFLYNIRKYR